MSPFAFVLFVPHCVALPLGNRLLDPSEGSLHRKYPLDRDNSSFCETYSLHRMSSPEIRACNKCAQQRPSIGIEAPIHGWQTKSGAREGGAAQIYPHTPLLCSTLLPLSLPLTFRLTYCHGGITKGGGGGDTLIPADRSLRCCRPQKKHKLYCTTATLKPKIG